MEIYRLDYRHQRNEGITLALHYHLQSHCSRYNLDIHGAHLG